LIFAVFPDLENTIAEYRLIERLGNLLRKVNETGKRKRNKWNFALACGFMP